MSRQCQLTGKKVKSGNNRPFSMKATKRTFRPNLFKKRVFNPKTGKWERMWISAKGIKTLKKWAKQGADKAEVVEAKTSKVNKEKVKAVKKLTPKQKKEQAAAAEVAKAEEAKPEVVKDMAEKTDK